MFEQAELQGAQVGPNGPPTAGVLSHIRRAQPPTNPLNGGLFHATAATKPDCAGAGSGERHDETEQTHF